jgi:uncharacterized protein YbjT (DUF2867 family)
MEIVKNQKTALLFGATGLVGGYCLEYLLAADTYQKVRIFGRRTVNIEHPKLEQHKVDFKNLEEVSELISGNDLFCCIGTTIKKAGSEEAFRRVDYTFAHKIAELGVKNKVNQFLLISSVGADKDSLFFYNQVKGELEDEVKLMPYWAIHIFQPSILLGERNENRWGESIAQKIGKFVDDVTGGMLKKYKPVEAQAVAKAMVMAAQKTEKGIHYYPSHVLQDLADNENLNLEKRKG